MSCMVLLSGADHIHFHANVHFQVFKTVSMATLPLFGHLLILYHVICIIILLLHVVSPKLKKIIEH